MRKYCIVPMCRSSSDTTPDKIFIYIPNDPDVREKWYEAARRDFFGLKKFSNKTKTVICQDHFNLEEDMENYFQFKIMGPSFSVIRMKKGVLPHKFECQEKYLSQLRIKLPDSQEILKSSSEKKSKPTILKSKQWKGRRNQETESSIYKTLPVILPKIEEVFIVNNFEENIEEESIPIITKIPETNLGDEPIVTHMVEIPNKPTSNNKFLSVRKDLKPRNHQFKKRRIVDLVYFLEQIKNLASHNVLKNCNFKHLTPTTELYNGLQSTIVFKCSNCNELFAIDLNENNNELNELLVHAAEITKLQQEGLKSFCDMLEFPIMTEDQYDNIARDAYINERTEEIDEDFPPNNINLSQSSTHQQIKICYIKQETDPDEYLIKNETILF